MHHARLAYLAGNHAPKRAVVARDIRTNGTTFTLECGHIGKCVPHFDTKSVKEWSCRICGEEIVKTAKQYAAEF